MEVPRSFSSLGFYSSESKLQLPLQSVVEQFKVFNVRQVIMPRDTTVNKAVVEVKPAKKRSAQEQWELQKQVHNIVMLLTEWVTVGWG